MSRPRFTILMPTHYRPDVIGYAIESVLMQTEADFELFVVGDGAGADSAEAVNRFDDRRLRWFDLPKAPGYGYANRNIAMREARGELIAYVADDDILLPDHLEKLGAAFTDARVQWAYSPALWVSSDGVAAPDLTNLDNEDERWIFCNSHNTISGGAAVFRAAAFPSGLPWPEHIESAADWYMMKSLLARHGTLGMRRLPLPTFLHFKAGSKSSRASNFVLLGAWLEVADAAPWWPEALRPVIPEAQPAQAAYLELLRDDPGYLEQLRRATIDVVNRAALDSLAPRAGAVASALERTQQEHLAQLRAMQAQLDDRDRQLEAMRTSTIWRATGPLRAVLHRLRGVRLP